MKATKLLLIMLSCMLVIGCKKDKTEEEPTPPTPQYPTISMDSLKNYFPYKTGDQIYFRGWGGNVIYTINKATFESEGNKIYINITMDGDYNYGDAEYLVEMKVEVTDRKTLRATFYECIVYSGEHRFPTEGDYFYDTSKSGDLPEMFTFTNGAIIKKGTGLSYYLDADSRPWTFIMRK